MLYHLFLVTNDGNILNDVIFDNVLYSLSLTQNNLFTVLEQGKTEFFEKHLIISTDLATDEAVYAWIKQKLNDFNLKWKCLVELRTGVALI
jgi:hypothetical protein